MQPQPRVNRSFIIHVGVLRSKISVNMITVSCEHGDIHIRQRGSSAVEAVLLPFVVLDLG